MTDSCEYELPSLQPCCVPAFLVLQRRFLPVEQAILCSPIDGIRVAALFRLLANDFGTLCAVVAHRLFHLALPFV